MLLAVDTATRMLSLALHDGERVLAECALDAGRKHSALLAPLIDDLMARVDVAYDDLTALAVCVGPGSYTGLRIGVALAKGMALARELPLIPASSLDIIAFSHKPTSSHFAATVPAGRGRVIWRLYARDGESWRAVGEAKLDDYEALLADCPAGCIVCGEMDDDGLRRLSTAIADGHGIKIAAPSDRLRRAAYLADLAWERLGEQGASHFPAREAKPIYMKAPG